MNTWCSPGISLRWAELICIGPWEAALPGILGLSLGVIVVVVSILSLRSLDLGVMDEKFLDVRLNIDSIRMFTSGIGEAWKKRIEILNIWIRRIPKSEILYPKCDPKYLLRYRNELEIF